MQQEQVILFDLDGTLIDSTEAILESFDQAFDYFGVETPSAEMITAQIGHPLDLMFISLGVDSAEVREFVAVYKKHYRKISREKTYLLAGAREAVEMASKVARVGVVTTKTAKYSIELLEHFELMDYFEVLIGREDVEFPKPHPEPVLKALSRLGSDTNMCWMIGDTCMDIISAKSAGINAIAVTSGYGSREQLSECCSFITESALDAVSYIVRD